MDETGERKIRWTKFKLFIMLLLGCATGYSIFLAITPLFNGEHGLKEFANLVFVALLIFIALGVCKIKKGHQFVFWASSLGLMVFSTIMFLKYESIFG